MPDGLEDDPLFTEETAPMASGATEVTVGKTLGRPRRDLPPKVRALVDAGWSEAAAREAVAVEEGDLGGDSGLE